MTGDNSSRPPPTSNHFPPPNSMPRHSQQASSVVSPTYASGPPTVASASLAPFQESIDFFDPNDIYGFEPLALCDEILGLSEPVRSGSISSPMSDFSARVEGGMFGADDYTFPDGLRLGSNSGAGFPSNTGPGFPSGMGGSFATGGNAGFSGFHSSGFPSDSGLGYSVSGSSAFASSNPFSASAAQFVPASAAWDSNPTINYSGWFVLFLVFTGFKLCVQYSEGSILVFMNCDDSDISTAPMSLYNRYYNLFIGKIDSKFWSQFNINIDIYFPVSNKISYRNMFIDNISTHH